MTYGHFNYMLYTRSFSVREHNCIREKNYPSICPSIYVYIMILASVVLAALDFASDFEQSAWSRCFRVEKFEFIECTYTYYLPFSLAVARRYRGYSISRQRDTRARPRRKRVPLRHTRSSDSFSPSRARFTPFPPCSPRVAGGGPYPHGGRSPLVPPSSLRSLPLPRLSFVSTLQFFSVSRRWLTGALVLRNQHPNRAVRKSQLRPALLSSTFSSAPSAFDSRRLIHKINQ